MGEAAPLSGPTEPAFEGATRGPAPSSQLPSGTYSQLRTPEGETTVDLPNPADWKVADGVDDTIETQTLEGQLLIGDVDPGDRLSPPFAIRVRAVRTGDRVILERDGDHIVRAFVGDRAGLVAARERAEGMRWPAVGVIVVMGIVSLVVAYRLFMQKPAA